MRRNSEVVPTHLLSLDLVLRRGEGVDAERFHPSAQETVLPPDWRKEGGLTLSSSPPGLVYCGSADVGPWCVFPSLLFVMPLLLEY